MYPVKSHQERKVRHLMRSLTFDKKEFGHFTVESKLSVQPRVKAKRSLSSTKKKHTTSYKSMTAVLKFFTGISLTRILMYIKIKEKYWVKACWSHLWPFIESTVCKGHSEHRFVMPESQLCWLYKLVEISSICLPYTTTPVPPSMSKCFPIPPMYLQIVQYTSQYPQDAS